jgi:formylmethanofuran dehydrogenase subunit E
MAKHGAKSKLPKCGRCKRPIVARLLVELRNGERVCPNCADRVPRRLWACSA